MKDGIFPALPREAYDTLGGYYNWSSIREALKSPAHYKQAKKAKREPTPALVMGLAAHLATLEPARFLREVVKFEGRRAGKDWDAFEAAHSGSLILKADDFDACLAMQRAVWDNPSAAKLLEGLQTEVSVLWTHHFEAPGFKAYDVPCKARLDGLGKRIVELKTTRDASRQGFPRECARYHLEAQLAMQHDGVRACSGESLPCFIVAVEKEPPYASSVWDMTTALDAGRSTYWQLLHQLHECEVAGEFPAYPGIEPMVLPTWAETHLTDVFEEVA